MTVLNPPLAVQSRTDTNADDFRGAMSAMALPAGGSMLSRGGILPGWGAGLSVAQRGAGANMSVDVGSGIAQVPAPTAGHGGWYVENDATLNVAIAAAHATLARIDVVIARVADPQYHVGGDGLAAIKVITGTPAGSPVAPTPPTSDGAYIVLAQVAVGAAVTSITNANITLNTSATRPFTVSLGGILPVANAAARTAITSPYVGMHVIELDTAVEYVWTGAAWRAIGPGPLGTLGYAEVTANQVSITTEVDLTGLTTTVTVQAGRRIRVTGSIAAANTATTNSDVLYIYQDGTLIAQAFTPAAPTAAGQHPQVVTAVLTPSAGSHTYKLRQTNTGGTTTAIASTNNKGYILVEDIGV